jgi:hypothetical protein
LLPGIVPLLLLLIDLGQADVGMILLRVKLDSLLERGNGLLELLLLKPQDTSIGVEDMESILVRVQSQQSIRFLEIGLSGRKLFELGMSEAAQ